MSAAFGSRATGHRRYHLNAELVRHPQCDDVGGGIELQVDITFRYIDNAGTEIFGGTKPYLGCEHDGRNGVPRTTSCCQQQREHGERRPLHRDLASGAAPIYTSKHDSLRYHRSGRPAQRRQIDAAELIAYLHPLADYPAPPLTTVARLQRPPRAQIVTVYTKADVVNPSDRPAVQPSDVVLSAVTREGLHLFLETLGSRLPESPFHYDPDELATQPMRFFAAEFVREAAFEQLHEELPYSVACEIDEFREGAEPVYIRAVLYVERDSQKGIVIGEGGRTIKALGAAARRKIEALLGQRVFLDLHVKVLPKWRRDEPSLKRLGYATS